jgi:cytochrome c oxidase subunit 2
MLSWLPENVSATGGDIDAILTLIYYVTGAWFLVTEGAIIFFLIRYRAGKVQRAGYVPGNSLHELAWILAPAVIVLFLDLWIDFRGADVWAKIKGHVPEGDVSVQVTGKQFNWEIVYPGPDKEFGTGDDLEMQNEIHVPVGAVVVVRLRSTDVIHSLFIPSLRFKQDAVPGREIRGWFQVTQPGQYEIPCSELCGFGHSGMSGQLFAHTSDDYQKWITEHWPAGK